MRHLLGKRFNKLAYSPTPRQLTPRHIAQPGSFAAFGASECSPCVLGFVATDEKAAFCDPCEAGKHANTVTNSCDACSPGKVSSLGDGFCTACEVGKFAPGGGNTGCIFCDDHTVLKGSTTNGDGSTSEASCVCGEGEYADADAGECIAVFEGLSSTVYGMNVTNMVLEPGYWRVSTASKEILVCLNKDHCVGGAAPSEFCAKGYVGPLCSVCEYGFAATGSGADLEVGRQHFVPAHTTN